MKIDNQNILEIKVIDHISALISYWDKDLVCRFSNAAFEDWFGKTKVEMIDKITLKDLLGPLFEINLPHIKGVFNGDTQTFQRVITLQNGSIRHSLTNYYPDIQNDKVIGFIVHVADVTHFKVVEEEFITTNDKINEQNKRLINFSNIVSHNLKSYSNNLAAILDLFDDADSQEEKIKMFDFLKRISKGFTATVNRLSEITKSQNLSSTKPERINLNEFIEKAKETLLFQIESTKTIFINKVDLEIEILANPIYMDSILLNILSNAIKYKQPNISPIIEISSFMKDNKRIIKIKDNGIGINLKKHGSDVFGIYKTFHGNTDAEGVGLFITKYQVETMGGQIDIESQVNIGTTLSITFNSI